MSSRHVDTIVHDGEVVTSSDVVRTSVAVKDGRIVALGPRELLPEAERYIDASGKYVLPGAIDAHMHIDSLKCDDWVDAPLAAAHSGITSPDSVLHIRRSERRDDSHGHQAYQGGGESGVGAGLRFSLHPAQAALHS